MNKKLRLMFVSLLTMSMLVGCGGSSDSASGNDEVTTEGTEADTHINVAPFRWVEGMDPGKDWNGYNSTRFSICEPLVTLNKELQIEGVLAESWEQIDDVTYVFQIREGVTFTNGNPLDAEAVKASLERVMAINARGGDAKINTIVADGHTLTITTTEPFSSFLNNLTEPMYTIVDVKDLDEVDTKPVGTGAYYVVEHVAEERIELAANENYWGGAPSIKTMTIKNVDHDVKVDAVLAGDIDVAQGPTMSTVAKAEGNTKGVQILTLPGARETDLVLNSREGHPLAEPTLRQAISFAINRQAIAQVAGNGYAQPIYGPFPESANYSFDRVAGQQYDVEKAKQLLTEGGYIDSDGDGYVELLDGRMAEFDFEFEPALVGTAMPEAVQDMLKTIGLKINLMPMETSSYDPTEHAEKDITVDQAFPVNVGDGQKFLTNGFSTGGSENYGGYSNAEYDALMDELANAFDPEMRMDIFVEAQQHLIDHVANVWLYAPDDITVVSEKMEGITLHPLNYYLYTNDWEIKN